MNFSKPEPIQSNSKKQSAFSSLVEKISAVIGLARGFGSMAAHDKLKDQLTPAQRDKVIRIIIYLLICFVCLGIFETFNLLVQLIKYICQ